MAAALRSRNPKISNPRSLFSTLSSPLSSPLSEKPSTPFRSLKSTIRSERDPDKLAEIFQNSSDSPRFRRDRSVFDLTVRKLASSRRSDLIDRVLGHQKSFAAAPASKSEGFWIRIMKLYSNSGMVDQAVRMFDQMEEIGCNRTDKSLCALLSTFLCNRQFDRLHESFSEIPKKFGISPSVVAYNLVLRAFVEEKSIESARSLVAKMEKENGVKPDILSYNILLRGFHDAGDEIGFNEILKEISWKGLSPNVTTYNYRILSHCKKNESFKAKELFDVMISKGIKPNLASYNAVIDGLSKEGDLTSAKSLFESMRSGGVLPNNVTYVTLVRHLVEKGEFDSALEMCKKSLKRKWVPPFESMVGLVNGLVKISKVDEAKGIVEKMKKKLTSSALDSWMKVEGTLPL
ncbi:small ribosomal subunit protein mS86 (rPPR1)-like [Magnolia sinica]|uniref:small ribosomal subunit protein mS86 (rPPR1)-like n=1 Tax=Magnolia sinica TaxID=86752 RepID=UPI00265AD44C|nr:small ribosomal subunit protein mS86 (rPPR1)-like [Magnolia sinica]